MENTKEPTLMSKTGKAILFFSDQGIHKKENTKDKIVSFSRDQEVHKKKNTKEIFIFNKQQIL